MHAHRMQIARLLLLSYFYSILIPRLMQAVFFENFGSSGRSHSAPRQMLHPPLP